MARTSCAGAIIFYIHGRTEEVLLVTTPRGITGFPKGKKEAHETTLWQTASREVLEETGLTLFHGQLLLNEAPPYEEQVIFELSDKQNPSVSLFIAKSTEEQRKSKTTFRPKELQESKWYTVEQAKKLLTEKNRAGIMVYALAMLKAQIDKEERIKFKDRVIKERALRELVLRERILKELAPEIQEHIYFYASQRDQTFSS